MYIVFIKLIKIIIIMTLQLDRNFLQLTYEEVFFKSVTSKVIWNRSTEADLAWGQTVRRGILNLDNVPIVDIDSYVDRALYDVSDSSESITINKNKGTDVYLPYKSIVQQGPLSPEEVIADRLARKMGVYLDAEILAQIINNPNYIDNGSITTGQSNGTPISLSTSNVINVIPWGKTLLRRNNIDLEGGNGRLLIIVDAIGANIYEQYILTKQNSFAAETFVKGYQGTVGGAELYISENLPGQFYLPLNSLPNVGDTITVAGYAFTFKSSLTTAGDVLIGSNASDSRQNILYALIQSQTAGIVNVKYIPYTNNSVQQIGINNLRFNVVNDNTNNRLFVTGTGTGRITLTGTGVFGTLTGSNNWVNFYFGLDSTIDIAIQRQIDARIVDHPFREGIIIRFDYLYGTKVFLDRIPKFFRIWIQSY